MSNNPLEILRGLHRGEDLSAKFLKDESETGKWDEDDIQGMYKCEKQN